jgi:hypothetical protein
VKATTLSGVTATALAAVLLSGCGEAARDGRSPALVVISRLEGAAGATPDLFGGSLFSDMVTNVQRTVNGVQVEVPTIFSDLGRVTMRLTLRDPGLGAPSSPTLLNEVTFSRYRVTYMRADGRNTPGVDVPYPFDSGVTFTVPAGGDITVAFEIVRHTAKQEAPLRPLASNGVNLATIAEVTFYGRDQAGNDVIVSGHIGIVFANFGDPS